jgi:hypothetical protein
MEHIYILWETCKGVFSVEADGERGNYCDNVQCLLYSRTKRAFATGAEVQGTESYVEG